MTCFHPLKAWYSKDINPTGKRSLVFRPDEALDFHDELRVPCGRCIGCRLESSRQWAARIECEKSLHEQSIFLTLTYSPENLKSLSLVPEDLTKFMKRLRKYVKSKYDKEIRFFACGEYGSQLSRPHFHVIIFGWRPVICKKYNYNLFTSPEIEKIWKYGFCPFGDVTFESAAYVARYVTKKINGDKADEHYNGRIPEFVRMSRRPGIASTWIEKFWSDVYPNDLMIIRDDVKCKPPKFFDKWLEKNKPLVYEDIKAKRRLSNEFRYMDELVERYSYDDLLDVMKYWQERTDIHESFDNFCHLYYDKLVLPVKEEVRLSKFREMKRCFENG